MITFRSAVTKVGIVVAFLSLAALVHELMGATHSHAVILDSNDMAQYAGKGGCGLCGDPSDFCYRGGASCAAATTRAACVAVPPDLTNGCTASPEVQYKTCTDESAQGACNTQAGKRVCGTVETHTVCFWTLGLLGVYTCAVEFIKDGSPCAVGDCKQTE